jgi:hypothetical protein
VLTCNSFRAISLYIVFSILEQSDHSHLPFGSMSLFCNQTQITYSLNVISLEMYSTPEKVILPRPSRSRLSAAIYCRNGSWRSHRQQITLWNLKSACTGNCCGTGRC